VVLVTLAGLLEISRYDFVLVSRAEVVLRKMARPERFELPTLRFEV
jgi:hypothetical protein